MREDRIARSLAAALAALAVLFAPAFLLFGIVAARLVLYFGLGCAAIGIAAGWLLGRKAPVLQIVVSVALAAAAGWFVGLTLPGGLVVQVALMGAGALLALWVERLFVTAHTRELRSGLLLAPLAAWLAAAFALFLTVRGNADAPQMWPLIIVPAAIWFALSAVMLNRLGIRQAARAGSGAGVPAGVRRSGAAGVLVFVAASLALASISTIVSFLADALRKIAYWVLAAIAWLATLFPFAGGQSGEGAGQQEMLPMDGGEASPLAQLISTVVMVLVIAAVLAAIVYGLYKLFPKLWRKLRERFGTLFASWRDNEDYRDRSESLLSIRQAMQNAGDQIRRIARRFRRHRRLADFPTNTGKARFLFREYLRGLISVGHEPHPAATASEVARPAPALAHAYNLARYGEEEPGDGEIERAREETKI